MSNTGMAAAGVTNFQTFQREQNIPPYATVYNIEVHGSAVFITVAQDQGRGRRQAILDWLHLQLARLRERVVRK